MDKDFTIVCIDPAYLGMMWPHCGHLFLRGTIECCKDKGETEVEVLKAAMHELARHLIQAHQKLTQFWVVIDDEAKRVIGAMTTEILMDEEHGKILWCNRMAGEQVTRWGHALHQRMIEFGKAEGVDHVVGAGRKALQRAYKNLRVVKDHGDGTFLYASAL